MFTVDTVHVGILDGARAIGVLAVLWFHFWQQTWLMPVYQTPFLIWMGVSRINPDAFRRCGYLFGFPLWPSNYHRMLICFYIYFVRFINIIGQRCVPECRNQ